MEQTHHLHEIAATNHRSVVINLLVIVKQVELVLELLERIARRDARLPIALDHILDFLVRVLSSGRLLDFLDQCVVVIRLVYEELLLLLNDDSKRRFDLHVGDDLIIAGLRADHLFNLAVEHFYEVVIASKLLLNHSRELSFRDLAGVFLSIVRLGEVRFEEVLDRRRQLVILVRKEVLKDVVLHGLEQKCAHLLFLEGFFS